jgi:hypothetical protein
VRDRSPDGEPEHEAAHKDNRPCFVNPDSGKHRQFSRFGVGRSGGTRTPSPRFWRPMLYQLSYTPTSCGKLQVQPQPSKGGDCLRPNLSYSTMLATTPAPTVRPPSRIAKRRPSSIAIGAIRFTTMAMLSPGITISVPSGSSTVPVTSVVRK